MNKIKRECWKDACSKLDSFSLIQLVYIGEGVGEQGEKKGGMSAEATTTTAEGFAAFGLV